MDYGSSGAAKATFPYSSTPVKELIGGGSRSKLECDFRDNGSFQPSAFSSNGLDVSNFEFSGFGQNERTLSSSSNNSSSTSFISDGSFNTILRNVQDDGFVFTYYVLSGVIMMIYCIEWSSIWYNTYVDGFFDSINSSDGFLLNSSPYRDDINAVDSEDTDTYRRHLENLESYKKIWTYSPFSVSLGNKALLWFFRLFYDFSLCILSLHTLV